MTAEWRKYKDTPEINDEMAYAEHGFLSRFKDGTEEFHYGSVEFSEAPTDYLICEPQPHADMQAIWVKTGQPVEFYDAAADKWTEEEPEWMDVLKYRFAAPKKEVIYYRDYLWLDPNRGVKREAINKIDKITPEALEKSPLFREWVHTEWQEMEID